MAALSSGQVATMVAAYRGREKPIRRGGVKVNIVRIWRLTCLPAGYAPLGTGAYDKYPRVHFPCVASEIHAGL